MADRGKLIELIDKAEEHSTDICVYTSDCKDCPGRKYGNKCREYLKADHLISNGVTVRERGRWVRAGGDLHYSGVLYCCSVCNKRHFVNGRHALVTLSYHDELFRTPNFCPNCGADMRGEEDA